MLITMRLSTISFAGTARTDVAVGISRLASMLLTTRAEVPLSFSMTSSGNEAGAGFAAGSVGALAGATGAATVAALALGAGVVIGCGEAGEIGAADFADEATGECSLGE